MASPSLHMAVDIWGVWGSMAQPIFKALACQLAIQLHLSHSEAVLHIQNTLNNSLAVHNAHMLTSQMSIIS